MLRPFPQQSAAAYDVSVYVSLLDEDSKPIKDAELEDFTINEDNTPVSLSSAAIVSPDDPVYVAILLDTSGSMVGENIKSAKEAASEFIDDLERDDQAALINFDDEAYTAIDFTDNKDDVQNELDNVEAVSNSGTCLYDALYNAVEMFATLDPSRRAIVVMTDGVDETSSGGECSIHTLDDVIDLATKGVHPGSHSYNRSWRPQ